MARIHYWQFLSDSTGAPIYGADICIFLAGSESPASIYVDEIGGEAISTTPQLKTNIDGFFEFWIGDSSEKLGYPSSQKFKLTWERIGIEEGMIDYIDIFPITLPVDVSDDNTERNKSVSNLLAKGWENHRLSTEHIIHGINEVNLAIDTPKRNKLVSNSLGILWQNHRLFSFNTETTSPSSDEAKAQWEDENNSDLYGAHGLRSVQLLGDKKSNIVFNKLVNNAICTKWNDHVDYDFSVSSDAKAAHGLLPVNTADLSENPTEEEMQEYRTYNKLVSNSLIKNVLKNLQKKPSTFIKKIKKSDWKPSLYEAGVYSFKIFHGLKTEYLVVSLFHAQDRINADGKVEKSKAIFSAEDIYILNKDEIEISVTELSDVELLIIANTSELETED